MSGGNYLKEIAAIQERHYMNGQAKEIELFLPRKHCTIELSASIFKGKTNISFPFGFNYQLFNEHEFIRSEMKI